MSTADIDRTVAEYAASARLAVEAGFDGIELHAANGYLIEQFLNANVNRRTDSYGAGIEGRNRFALAIARATAAAIGAHRVGIRLSPYGVFNSTGAFADVEAQYLALTQQLSDLGLLYMHVLDHSAMGAPAVPAELKSRLRAAFRGLFILAGGFDRASAERALQAGQADLIAFARPFLANPDLVARMRADAALNAVDARPSTHRERRATRTIRRFRPDRCGRSTHAQPRHERMQDSTVTWKNVPTQTVTAGGVTFAYRELGADHPGPPVVFLIHLAAVLDNWDPRIVDGIAAKHRVIAFDNRGVGASSGSPATSMEEMARDAITFIKAMGFDQVDLFGFSMGGMVAQEIVLMAPQLVRRMILTGTERSADRDKRITIAALQAQLRARPWPTSAYKPTHLVSSCSSSRPAGATAPRTWCCCRWSSCNGWPRWRAQDHRGDPGSAGHREDPHAPGPAGQGAASLTCPRPGAASGLSAVNHRRSSGLAPRVAGTGCARGFPG